MKTLITHINPHLDDIFAIWLFRKYHPEFKDAQLEFISASHAKADEANENRVFVGTGGGRFDEHKEGLESCAGSLVYQYLKQANVVPQDRITQKALEQLVEWNYLIDTGKAPKSEFNEFSVQSFIRVRDNTPDSSKKSVELGMDILDRILEVLKKKQQSLIDWEKRIQFESKFGKSYAVVSETINREFCKQVGGDLFLMYDPKYKSVQFFTPFHDIDLKPIYDQVKRKDLDASWFLHQSHHMVICGSASAPDTKPTKLSFEELIEVAKSI